MTLARNLGAVVLAAAWLLSVSQGTFSQANAQAQSPSPGPSDRTTAIPYAPGEGRLAEVSFSVKS